MNEINKYLVFSKMSLLLNMKQNKKKRKNKHPNTYTQTYNAVHRRKPVNGAEWMIGDFVHGVPIHARGMVRNPLHTEENGTRNVGNFPIKRFTYGLLSISVIVFICR